MTGIEKVNGHIRIIHGSELAIEDAYATAHFVVFGQMRIVINEDIPKNQKDGMIRNTLIEFMKGMKKS